MAYVSERNALSAYRWELAHKKQLTREAERELAAKWRENDPVAQRRLIEACLPFVISIAYEYRRWGIPLEDLIQEGNIGLLKAAARFDPERGCRLATYASYWVRAEIREFVMRAYRSVRLGSSKAERRAVRYYRKTRDRDPESIAKASGLPVSRVEELLPLLLSRDVELDESGTFDVPQKDRLKSNLPSPEESVAASESDALYGDALNRAVGELPEREKTIIALRFLTEEPETLEAVGVRFGISKERVRQLEERAKRRVRERVEQIVGAPVAA